MKIFISRKTAVCVICSVLVSCHVSAADLRHYEKDIVAVCFGIFTGTVEDDGNCLNVGEEFTLSLTQSSRLTCQTEDTAASCDHAQNASLIGEGELKTGNQGGRLITGGGILDYDGFGGDRASMTCHVEIQSGEGSVSPIQTIFFEPFNEQLQVFEWLHVDGLGSHVCNLVVEQQQANP